jgi:cobalt-zinc-cadmium efflux system membrane fusion protein
LFVHLHFVFLTGVYKFTQTSIFSNLNNLQDLTFDRQAGTLIGYTEKELREAHAKWMESKIALSQAKQTLKNFSMNKSQIQEIEKTQDTSSSFTLHAPMNGKIVHRNLVKGDSISPAHVMFEVADLSSMWAYLDIYENDFQKVKEGQSCFLQIEGLSGEIFSGKIMSIGSEIDPKTRSLKVRAKIDNPQSLLKSHMFGKAKILIHQNVPMLLVPKSSVQWDGCCNIVFIQISETLYAPKKVALGCETQDHYEVLSGLDEGEKIVTEGSFLLKTEILKSSIGAGCCETGAEKKGE